MMSTVIMWHYPGDIPTILVYCMMRSTMVMVYVSGNIHAMTSIEVCDRERRFSTTCWCSSYENGNNFIADTVFDYDLVGDMFVGSSTTISTGTMLSRYDCGDT